MKEKMKKESKGDDDKEINERKVGKRVNYDKKLGRGKQKVRELKHEN